MTTKKKTTKSAAKASEKSKTVAPKKTKTVKAQAKSAVAKPTSKPASKPAARPVATSTKATAAPKPVPPVAVKVTPSVTAKKNVPAEAVDPKSTAKAAPAATPAAGGKPAPAKPRTTPRTTVDDLALDVDEKDQLLEEEKRDLAKALREDEDEPLETAFVPTDTSERIILVVDEDGPRRSETVNIVQQILPNAVIELADDPEEALEVMEEAEFDTFVVNFLMPGFSASPFVKSVTNHPDRPLLIGFAADKISDALDQRKGLKIIPLKRLFDLDVPPDAAKEKVAAED